VILGIAFQFKFMKETFRRTEIANAKTVFLNRPRKKLKKNSSFAFLFVFEDFAFQSIVYQEGLV
jgi:hypothetical protein